MKFICKIFRHNIVPTSYQTWKESGNNFVCLRCGYTQIVCTAEIVGL